MFLKAFNKEKKNNNTIIVPFSLVELKSADDFFFRWILSKIWDSFSVFFHFLLHNNCDIENKISRSRLENWFFTKLEWLLCILNAANTHRRLERWYLTFLESSLCPFRPLVFKDSHIDVNEYSESGNGICYFTNC